MVSPFGSLVPELLNRHVRSVQLTVNAGTGATLPPGSTRLIVFWSEAALPHPSVAVIVTTYVPVDRYAWLEELPVVGSEPAPQRQEYVMTSPVFGSTVPVLLVEQVSDGQTKANVGVGATLPGG